MAELADVLDLGSSAARRVGSNPTTRTKATDYSTLIYLLLQCLFFDDKMWASRIGFLNAHIFCIWVVSRVIRKFVTATGRNLLQGGLTAACLVLDALRHSCAAMVPVLSCAL